MPKIVVSDPVLFTGPIGQRSAMVIKGYGNQRLTGQIAKFASDSLRAMEIEELAKLAEAKITPTP